MKRVISTLSEGFETIVKQPWILVLPVLLDVLLWLGPKISLRPFIEQGLRWIADLPSQVDTATWLSMQQAFEEVGIQQIWEVFAERFNLLSVLSSVNIVSVLSFGLLDLPSLIAVEHLEGTLPGEGTSIVEISNGLGALGAFAILLLFGLLLIVFFQGMIAQQVRDERISLRFFISRFGRYVLYVLAVVLSLGIILVVIGGPLSLLFFFVGAFSPTLMQLLLLVAGAIMLWFSLYLMFVVHGILLGDETPIKSLWASMNIVHKDFWAVLFLLLLTRLIRTGFLFVWSRLTGTVPGLIVAILGNAFLGASLATASFCFYRDSFVAWREHLAQLANLE